MSTAQADAATHAPARAPRAQAEGSAAPESLLAHVKRSLRVEISELVCGVLDPSIALLQRLRQRSGGADADAHSHAHARDDRSRSSNARPGAGHDDAASADDAEAEAVAPKPKRRLLAYLIYLTVLLMGCAVGGALAYELLAKVLERQANQTRRVELAMSKQSKSVASNQKKLDEALAKRTEAEKKLEEAQAKRIETEKKLEEYLRDSKAAAEKQKKLDEAVKLLESIRAADRSGGAARAPAAGGAARKPGQPKSGDCSLLAGDVKALKDCVANFNR